MAQSLNTKVDVTIGATSYLGVSTYGNVMIGDRAFEFYNDKNVQDYIQIPWNEIDRVAASVMLKGKWIPRFVIITKANGNFSFSSRDNKKLLQAMKNYLGADQLVHSLSFFGVMKRGLKTIVTRKQ